MVNNSKQDKLKTKKTSKTISRFPLFRGNSKAQINSFQLNDNKDSKPKLVRGNPYHEFLIIFRHYFKLYAVVYNDIGKVLMPDQVFAEIDTEVLKEEFGAIEVVKNGPRFFVMDEIVGYSNGKARIFGGYTMDHIANLKLPISIAKKRNPYEEQYVNRKTKYTFYAGEKIYEIISDTNEVYTLQSCSREIDVNLTIDDLDNLGSRLQLPRGWEYRARTLNENVSYYIDGSAYVLQDEFKNSYQKNPY
jgi:hypothetical protein